MRIIWDEEATKALKELYNYYYALSSQGAIKLYNDILAEAERLAIFPNLEKVEPLLSDYPIIYRSLVVRQNYKLIYFVDEEKQVIVIIRLWDCRQNPTKLSIEH